MRNKIKFLLVFFSLFLVQFSAFAQDQEGAPKEETLDIGGIIFGHIYDAYDWHIFSIGDHHLGFSLPIIIYDTEKGLQTFSYKKITESANQEYNGYGLNEDGKIMSLNGDKIYDLSITKNTLALFIASIILLIIFLRVPGMYKKRGVYTAPTGWQNAVESAILFIRDDVAKENIGPSYMKFTPFLLSLFFFIWLINMLGLIPGGANLSGNIAFTAALAVATFIVMLFRSKKSYWAHFFNPTGVPLGVKFLLVPIELMSLIIKPTALTIRLFANMLAGHLVILSFVLLIFIFAQISTGVGIGFSFMSVALQIFMLLIKVMVCAIQAFIFVYLSAVFIGAMVEEEHA